MIHVVAFGSAHTTNAVPGNSILVNLLNAGAAVGQNIAAKSVRRAPGLFIATGVLQRLSEQDYSAAYARYELPPLFWYHDHEYFGCFILFVREFSTTISLHRTAKRFGVCFSFRYHGNFIRRIWFIIAGCSGLVFSPS